VNTRGEFSMEFNSKGMFRGVCDSSGNCSVGIWEEMIPIKVDVDVVLNSDLSRGARTEAQKLPIQ
jgi:hypothetical protein